MRRYFLDRDNSGHWYLIEERYRSEWNDWCELDEDDEKSWEVPRYAGYAERTDSPSNIHFTDPIDIRDVD